LSIKRLFVFIAVISVTLLLVFSYFNYQNSKALLLKKLETESELNAVTAKSALIAHADRQAHRFAQASGDYARAMGMAQEYFEEHGSNGSVEKLHDMINAKFPGRHYDVFLISTDLVVYAATYQLDIGLDFKRLPFAQKVLSKAFATPTYMDVSHVIHDRARNCFIQYAAQKARSGGFIIQLGLTYEDVKEKDTNLANIAPSMLSGTVYVVTSGHNDIAAVEDKYVTFYQGIKKNALDKLFRSKAPEFKEILGKFTNEPMPTDEATLNRFLDKLFAKNELLIYRGMENGRHIDTIITPYSSYQELQEHTRALLVMSFDETDAYLQLDELKMKLVLFLGATSVLLGLTLYIAYLRVVRPLARLQKNMEAGELFDPQKLFSDSDEIAKMIRIYNELLASLNKSALENKELLESFKTFTGNSIHQIRTPISVMKISQEMLKGESQEVREQIKSSIVTMEHIYDNLAYRVQRDYIEFPQESVDISAVLRERIKLFSVVASANDKEITATIEDGLCTNINKTEMEYLIDNNISNAIKYGSICKPIAIKLWKDEENILLSFENEGKPIENQEAIFERFTRETKEKQGHGIGLHIVKEIAAKYDIGIAVRFENGKNIFEYAFKQE
jgi:signal transduction histidine kinase